MIVRNAVRDVERQPADVEFPVAEHIAQRRRQRAVVALHHATRHEAAPRDLRDGVDAFGEGPEVVGVVAEEVGEGVEGVGVCDVPLVEFGNEGGKGVRDIVFVLVRQCQRAEREGRVGEIVHDHGARVDDRGQGGVPEPDELPVGVEGHRARVEGDGGAADHAIRESFGGQGKHDGVGAPTATAEGPV